MDFYHATFKRHVKSIEKKGLLSHADGIKTDNWGWADDYTDEVFLCQDKEDAISYAKNAPRVSVRERKNDIYVVTVELDEDEVVNDPYSHGYASKVHHGSIPADRIASIDPVM